MKREYMIDDKNSYIATRLFPYRATNIDSVNKHFVVLGIGGNIGDSARRFEHLINYMRRVPFVQIVETSPIIKNPPFGYLDQSYFFNAIISIYTTLLPQQLLGYMQNIERIFRRKRSFQDAPRTLDIDIIMYENRKINKKNLQIPHKSWSERDSVMIPLSYMKGIR